MNIYLVCFLAVVHNFEKLSVSFHIRHPISLWLTMQVSKVVVNKKPWKRCATHFHISHLIQILNIQENQERLPLQPNQLRPQEGSSLGVLMAINNFQGVENRLNAIASPTTVCNSTTERNISEAKTGSLQHQRLHQDQPQAALASGAYNSQQQVNLHNLYCNLQLSMVSSVVPLQFFFNSLVAGRFLISCHCQLEVVGWKLRIVLVELEMD